uniref:uncharacterized protein LOC118155308 isoform X5 n=1 Tax=Callithrix jacchus TaxID=9483 RepID=UPI0023DD2EA7|nr:uncharacterized protein LOC118155308 isoform X5 [Callithrix jacchus]
MDLLFSRKTLLWTLQRMRKLQDCSKLGLLFSRRTLPWMLQGTRRLQDCSKLEESSLLTQWMKFVLAENLPGINSTEQVIAIYKVEERSKPAEKATKKLKVKKERKTSKPRKNTRRHAQNILHICKIS